jgi:XTP/dITP diphosphohydrolase
LSEAQLVVASGNAGKLAELRALLAALPLRVLGLGDFAPVAFPEEGDDYAANAAAKARAAAGALGRPALADDSGLEVEGLGGAPGPRSARYGGPGLADAERSALLLRELAARAGASRRARFVCVAALALPGGELRSARGSCAGRIARAPRGASGFGYDPIFEPSEPGFSDGRTLAELGEEAKARISHRARAVAALLPAIRELVLVDAAGVALGGAAQASPAKRS